MIGSIVEALTEQIFSHALRTASLLLIIAPLLYLVLNEVQRKTTRLAGFAGPPGLPIIGNIYDIRYNAAEQYRKWSEKYGAVYQIQLGNIPVLVVNSAASAKEIFGNHSQALSSRPVFYTFHKVVSNTAGTTIGTSPFSDSLRRRRKGAASALNKPSVQTYIPHLDRETRIFIKECLEDGDAGSKPVDPTTLIQRLSLSLALTLNWGRGIERTDPMFGEITHVEEMISRFRSTTGNLQDYIPFLRLNPINTGSAVAKDMRRRRDVYLKRLNDDLEDRMEKSIDEPCIQGSVARDAEAKLNKEELTSISLTMLSGGLDTLTTLMQWAIALLAKRPDIQETAIKAIRERYTAEEVLGDPEDDCKCAYIVALAREFLRYYTVLRLALPRASTKDITFDGKLVPSGMTVFLNAWACNMDPKVFEDPRTFDPRRYLENPDLPLFTYGLGYRMCAGSLLANRELYLVFLRLLSSFEITIPEGEDVDVDPVRGSSDPNSLVTMPREYKVLFKPRDERILKVKLEEGAI